MLVKTCFFESITFVVGPFIGVAPPRAQIPWSQLPGMDRTRQATSGACALERTRERPVGSAYLYMLRKTMVLCATNANVAEVIRRDKS